MRSPSDNYKVSWDIQENISTVSWDIKIKWNLLEWIANSISWYIKLTWYNNWRLITVSGNVQVWTNNKFIQTTSWSIEGEKNQWVATSVSWDIEFEVNWWEITTTSWDIELEENNGIIVTTSWDIIIWSINIQQDRMSVNMGNVWTVFSKGVNNVISWSNITIVDWVVMGWNVQWGSSNVWKEKYIVQIDNLKIDYLKKTVYVNGNECDINELNSNWDGRIDINSDDISIIYQGQNIVISDNGINVTSI